MKKVNIWPWAHHEKKFLLKGDCFEENLLEQLKEEFEYYKDRSDTEGYKYSNLLYAKLEELKDTGYPQDILHTLFMEHVTLDFEFARQLNLYDVLRGGCFISESDVGKALIYLICNSQNVFILYQKRWVSAEEISLEFEMTYTDWIPGVHAWLVRGRIGEADYDT